MLRFENKATPWTNSTSVVPFRCPSLSVGLASEAVNNQRRRFQPVLSTILPFAKSRTSILGCCPKLTVSFASSG